MTYTTTTTAVTSTELDRCHRICDDQEFKAEQKRQNERHILLVDGLPASERVYQRVLSERGLGRRPTAQEIEQDARHYAPRAFSLMR